MPRLLLAAVLLPLVNCGSSGEPTSSAVGIDNIMQTGNEPPATVTQLADADQERVCRTAIADMNGHSPTIVKVMSLNAGIVRVRYTRPSDGKLWTNECRTDGRRVIWRTVDAFGPGSGLGRWRIDPMDEVLTYTIDGNNISITTTFPGEAPSTKTYAVR